MIPSPEDDSAVQQESPAFGTCLEDRAWVHHLVNTQIPKPLHSDQEVIAYVRECNAHQAPMTFNVGIYQDGSMAEASVEQLRRLSDASKS